MGHHSTFSVLSLVTVTMVLMAASSIAGGRTQASPPDPVGSSPGTAVWANTATMRTRLDAALDRLGAATDCAVIDTDTLADGDARRGYGTPTVLYNNRDLFGMPEPTPPIPSPT